MPLSQAVLQLMPKPAFKRYFHFCCFLFFFWCPCFRAFCKSGFGTISLWFWEKHYLPSSYGLLVITIAHVLGLYLNLLVCTYLCLWLLLLLPTWLRESLNIFHFLIVYLFWEKVYRFVNSIRSSRTNIVAWLFPSWICAYFKGFLLNW